MVYDHNKSIRERNVYLSQLESAVNEDTTLSRMVGMAGALKMALAFPPVCPVLENEKAAKALSLIMEAVTEELTGSEGREACVSKKLREGLEMLGPAYNK